jgi:hypothetical protein
MSLPTEWLERAFHLQDSPHIVKPEVEANATYEHLLACYRSEQMSAAQLRERMDADPAFAAFVGKRINGDGSNA